LITKEKKVPQGIVLRRYGGAEELVLEDIVVGAPGPTELRLRQTAIGVNFHDIYVRTGLYKTLALPGTPGVEAVGVVEQIGSAVNGFRPGERIGYVTPSYGAYAEARLIDVRYAIKIPEDIDDRTVAASLVKGLTAQMLVSKLRVLASAETCLVYAAAGGVGQLLCHFAQSTGAQVIGVVGSSEKVEAARAAGCNHVIVRTKSDVASEVMKITEGRGVDIVYDSVGRDTFETSLEVLAIRGHLVNFGQSSGPVEPFPPSRLAAKSNAVWRPILFHFLIDPQERQEMADTVFSAIRSSSLSIAVDNEFKLGDAARAHAALEGGKTTSSIILVP